MIIKLTVKEMHCKSCKMLIEDELEDIGARDIQVEIDEDTETGIVSCEHEDRDKVVSAIESLGEYKIV